MSVIRVCICCGIEKELEEFNKSKTGINGRTSKCKFCRNKEKRLLYNSKEEVRVKNSLLNKRWIAKNKEKALSNSRAWQAANRKKAAEYARVWRKDNPVKRSVQQANRRASKKQAIPSLSELDQEFNSLFMYEAFDLAKIRTKLTGVLWHVDHIIPLRSKLVCGLHYFRNIQVITAYENLRKNNVSWEGKP